MPRYFFHLYDDLVIRDHEGQELPDASSAHRAAIGSARQIACAEVLEGHLNLAHRIEVEDDVGAHVTTVHFKDVVKIQG